MYTDKKQNDSQTPQQATFHERRIKQIYDFPAKIYKAQMHKFANKFRYKIDRKDNEKPSICACCSLPIHQTAINIFQETTPSTEKHSVDKINEFKLNSGTSMFFTFIKMSIIFLLLRFLITDLYNLISSTTATYCIDNPDKCSSLSNLSTFNKNTSRDEGMVNVVDILNLISVLASIVFFIIYRRYQFRIYCIVESTSFSQDDYTLFVENIPIYIPQEDIPQYIPEEDIPSQKNNTNQVSYQKLLKEGFEKKINEWIQNDVLSHKNQKTRLQTDFHKLAKEEDFKYKPKIRSISLCFDLTQIKKIDNIREKLMDQIIAKVQKIDEPKEYRTLERPIKEINKYYIELSKRFAMDESASFNLSHFVGKAYISFEYQHYCQFLLRQYQKNKFIYIKEKPLTLQLASQPSDVYWQNMRIDHNERLQSIFKSYLVLIMTLTFSFFALMGLELLQQESTPEQQSTTTNPVETQSSFLSYAFTLLMTILINVINYILGEAIQTLTESQKHKSKTDQITSLVVKNVVSQFFNTALIYYIISVINPQIGPLTQNGIVVKIMSLVAVSGAVNIVMNILQIKSLIIQLLNKWKYKDEEYEDTFQVQLNKKMEDPEFSFAQRYAYYIMQVYVVSFYACIAPSITIILALIFVAQYWVDKANLFYRFSCPTDFNYRLPRLNLKIFQVSILVLAVGNLIFLPEVHYSEDQYYYLLNWITLGIALLYVVFVICLPDKWQQKLFYDVSAENKSYTECLRDHDFDQVYWLSNPATSFIQEKDLNKDGKKFVDYSSCISKIGDKEYYYSIVNQIITNIFPLKMVNQIQK